MKETKIEWCDDTVNFWSGCTKVSAGCARCYAETLSKRKTGNIGQWGKGAPRKLHESAFKAAFALNKKGVFCPTCKHAPFTADLGGCGGPGSVHCDTVLVRRKIFSLSLGDWLDPEVPIEWLARMLDTIRQCDRVIWILVTKRPEHFSLRLHEAMRVVHNNTDIFISGWLDGYAPKNVWLLTSVENQQAADTRIPELLKIPAVVHGLSLEPLLGPVDVRKHLGEVELESYSAHNSAATCFGGIEWMIIGGESGQGARPCNKDWILSLIQQGRDARVPVFFKQFGSYMANEMRRCGHDHVKSTKGQDPNEWPDDVRVRQFPEVV